VSLNVFVTYCKSLGLLELARVQSRPLYQRRDGVACNVSQGPLCDRAATCHSLPETDLREVAMVCVNSRKPPEQVGRGCYGECGELKCANPGKLLTRRYFPIQKALLNPAGVTTAWDIIDMHRKHATIFIYRDTADDRLETCCSSHVENIWTSLLHRSYTSNPSHVHNRYIVAAALRELIVQAPGLPHY
jgi:hypothetical protein